MRGVNIGGKHTYWDWSLILREHPNVSPPVPKHKMVEVPASDDPIDITNAISGKVHFQCREIVCKFTMMAARDRWSNLYTEILEHLHGQRLEITLDHDPDYFYTGRLEISEWNPGQTVAELTIKATVNPYKTSRHDGRKVL